jgi:hypothetical protein
MTMQPLTGRGQPDSLADVLERVLDKGIVIVGDIVVNVLDIELLSLKLRLFVSSAQTAQEMGMDWWTRDPFFTSQDDAKASGSSSAAELRAERARLSSENNDLRERVESLERMVTSDPTVRAGDQERETEDE